MTPSAEVRHPESVSRLDAPPCRLQPKLSSEVRYPQTKLHGKSVCGARALPQLWGTQLGTALPRSLQNALTRES